MERKTLFGYLSFLIIFIFLLNNLLAPKLHLYYTFSYFDLIMHFIGGFWLSIVFLWIFYKDINKKSFKNIFLKVFINVLIISLIWEFYEIFVNDIFAKDNLDYVDIFTDLLADLLGSLISFFIFIKVLKKNKNNI